MEEPESEKILFYDLFSETISYLEHQGFQVDFQVEWSDSRMQVSTDYVSRILDNITSSTHFGFLQPKHLCASSTASS